MNKTMLSEIKEGQYAKVTDIRSCGSIRRRFMDLGLIKGGTVGCIISSRGGMKAYNIRGAVIAIRQRDAQDIDVEVYEGEDGSPGR